MIRDLIREALTTFRDLLTAVRAWTVTLNESNARAREQLGLVESPDTPRLVDDEDAARIRNGTGRGRKAVGKE